MSTRWRYALGGLMLAVGVFWVAGWIASHWVDDLRPLFGPTGVLPAPLGGTLVILGSQMVWWTADRRGRDARTGPAPTSASADFGSATAETRPGR